MPFTEIKWQFNYSQKILKIFIVLPGFYSHGIGVTGKSLCLKIHCYYSKLILLLKLLFKITIAVDYNGNISYYGSENVT